MKKTIVILMIIATFMLAGCSKKDAAETSSKGNSSASKVSENAETKNLGSKASNDSNASNAKGSEVKNQVNTIKPGTVPKLNQTNKAKLNNALNPVINRIDESLKSLDDANDININ